MADSFTWIPKFGEVCDMLEEGDRRELVYAIAMYGMYGEEVELPFHLKLAFAALKDDVDYSKKRHAGGSKGGSAKAAKKAAEGAGKKPVSDGGEPAGDTCARCEEEPAQGTCDRCEEEGETPTQGTYARCESEPSGGTYANQSKAKHSNAEQSKAMSKGAKATRFRPPTAEDVEAYAAEHGLAIDAAAFVDFYASKGWKVGSAAMKDWKAAVRNWCRRDEKEAKGDARAFGAW